MRIPSSIKPHIFRAGTRSLPPLLAVMMAVLVVEEGVAQGLGQSDDEPGFHPQYRSSVRVFKTNDTWDQSFTLNERLLSPIQVSLSLGSNIQNDIARNDLRIRNARTNNRVDYYVFRGLSVGLIGELSKTNQTSLTEDTQLSKDNVRMSLDLDRIWWRRWRTRVTGQTGMTGSERSTRRSSIVSGSLTETEQTGPSMGLAFGLSNDAQILNADGTPDPGSPPPVLRLRLDVTTDVVQQETREVRTDFQADQTTVEFYRVLDINLNNVNRRASAEVGWSGWRWLDATFTAQRTFVDDLRPVGSQSGGLERSEQNITDGGFTVRFMPWQSMTITATYRMVDGRLRSNVTTASNKDQTNQTLQANAEFPLFGFDLRGELEQKRNADDFKPIPGTSASQDHENEFIRARLQAKRSLGTKLSTTVTADIALNQDFYDEAPDQDRDRQDRTFDITLNYSPLSKLRGRVAFTQYRQRQVSVRGASVANTNTQERLTVAAGYTFTVATGYNLNQSLNITAQSRVFDFNDEGQSDLTRTNRLDTDFTAQLFPEIRVTLEHGYNFRNSGKYALGEDGVRRFSLDREFLEQKLTVGTEYKPIDWFTFGGDQELRVVVNRSPGSEGTRNTRYVLRVAANARKRLMDSIDTSLKVERVLTTQEDHYWDVSLSANKRF